MIKGIEKWGKPYLQHSMEKHFGRAGETHVMITICDHFEPLSPHASKSLQQGTDRVNRWLDVWPKVAGLRCNSDGYPPNIQV